MRLFLSGLPFFAQDQDLAQRFSLPLAAVHVARDHRRDRSLGFGFINVPGVEARPLLDQGVFEWGGRTVSVRGAHAEHLETIRAAHEYGPADSETLRTGKFEGCAICALNNADLREARSHLAVCDPARQRVFAELLRRRRRAAQMRLAARAGGRHKSPSSQPVSLHQAA